MSPVTDTRKSLQDLISNLQEEQTRLGDQLAALHEAVKALDGDDAASPLRTGPQPQPGPQPQAIVSAGKLLRVLRKTNGVGTEALAAEANAERPQVLALLKELEAGGEVRRTGERRGTKWFADAPIRRSV